MKETEFLDNRTDLQKSRIRSRYRGINPDLLEVIPAKPTEGLYNDDIHRRVAIYARVSTDNPRQTSSYELQKNYYEDYISRYPNWELVHIYAELKQQNEIIFEAENERNVSELEYDELKGLARFTTNPKAPTQLTRSKRLNGRKLTERTTTGKIRKVYLNG